LRTCKYRPDWPTKGFATKADAKAWVKSFAKWYNGEHMHSAIRFVTPNTRHAGKPYQSLCKSTRTKPGTPVRQNPQLATRRTRLAQSGNRNQRP